MNSIYTINSLYAIISVIIVSLVAVIAAIPLLLKRKISNKTLLFLLSLSVGVLLSTVFIHFIPEMHDYSMIIALYILAGFLVMFILEKIVHWHHKYNCEKEHCGHNHAYNLAPINLIGDAIHNFLDGLVIAGAYSINITLGITATISIIFHEIPQEIADFGILLYSGLSKKRALLFNFLSAATAILGAITGLILVDIHGFKEFILPFAAGNFIYIAASNLTPKLHLHCKLKDTLHHLFAIIIGITLIILITIYAPHIH